MNARLRIVVAQTLTWLGIALMTFGLLSVVMMLVGEVNTGWQTLFYGGLLYVLGQLLLLLHELSGNVGALASTLRFVSRHIQDDLREKGAYEDIFADLPDPDDSVRVGVPDTA